MTEGSNAEYTQAALCFPIRGDEVLLAEKQKKIGAGFLNGFGGKVESTDRDIFDTNFREVEEEIGIRVKTVQRVGEITFHNPSDDDELKKMIVHIFTASEWVGEPTETDEMKKIAWYKINELDFDKFLSADTLFLPQILGGKCIRGLIEYNDDWSVKSSKIEEVDAL
jgi:8-oxo-dGTP diphosphatase